MPRACERRLPVSELGVGDRFVVRPGETVATDGEVLVGNSAIDRSAMTGESLPMDVGPGDQVVGGTVSDGGRLMVRGNQGRARHTVGSDGAAGGGRPEREGGHTTAGRPDRGSVRSSRALASRSNPGFWLLAGGSSEQAAQCRALGVDNRLSVRPRAGDADGTTRRVGKGARLGIFFKGYQGLEASRHVDTVVLDKTGTVTAGQMAVTDVGRAPGCRSDQCSCGGLEH